eukprot:365693-Chlamydomonas_euryale.AAC.3
MQFDRNGLHLAVSTLATHQRQRKKCSGWLTDSTAHPAKDGAEQKTHLGCLPYQAKDATAYVGHKQFVGQLRSFLYRKQAKGSQRSAHLGCLEWPL